MRVPTDERVDHPINNARHQHENKNSKAADAALLFSFTCVFLRSRPSSLYSDDHLHTSAGTRCTWPRNNV